MSRFTLTPAARSDLKDISDYIESDSPNAAKRVRTKLRAAMVRLGEHPALGHLREDLADEPLRFWTVYSFMIIYRSDRRPIEILRVLHGSRDVRSVLRHKG